MSAVLTLLNTSVLSTYGTFTYSPLAANEAAALAQRHHAAGALQSAIGHEPTAICLAVLLQVPVPAHRIEYLQDVGGAALVFKLLRRIGEGQVLRVEEILAIGFEFGLLLRTA